MKNNESMQLRVFFLRVFIFAFPSNEGILGQVICDKSDSVE